MVNLKQANSSAKALEKFISEHEPLDAPKEAFNRYIDASAMPLESHKEGQSKFFQGSDDDCK